MIPYLDDLAQGGTATATLTPSQAGTGFFNNPDEKAVALRWLVGITGTWIILTAMVDLGETADLGVAFAMVIMASVLMAYGPAVFQNLGITTTPSTGA
jgi:hypothetical protein